MGQFDPRFTRAEAKFMKAVAWGLVAVISALHFYIAWFEMFAWTSRGPKIFTGFPPELFEQTIALAANQGVYNAFLAVGLLWALVIRDAKWKVNVAMCFLGFVLVAGIVAAFTVSLRPGLVQIVPSGVALLLLVLSKASGQED
jgi:putative membrane protein